MGTHIPNICTANNVGATHSQISKLKESRFCMVISVKKISTLCSIELLNKLCLIVFIINLGKANKTDGTINLQCKVLFCGECIPNVSNTANF